MNTVQLKHSKVQVLCLTLETFNHGYNSHVLWLNIFAVIQMTHYRQMKYCAKVFSTFYPVGYMLDAIELICG